MYCGVVGSGLPSQRYVCNADCRKNGFDAAKDLFSDVELRALGLTLENGRCDKHEPVWELWGGETTDNVIYKYDGVVGRATSLMNMHFVGKQAKGQAAFERLVARIKKWAAENDYRETVRFKYGKPRRVTNVLEIEI